MAQTVEEILGDAISGGLRRHKVWSRSTDAEDQEIVEAGHPIPDASGMHGNAAGEAIAVQPRKPTGYLSCA